MDQTGTAAGNTAKFIGTLNIVLQSSSKYRDILLFFHFRKRIIRQNHHQQRKTHQREIRYRWENNTIHQRSVVPTYGEN